MLNGLARMSFGLSRVGHRGSSLLHTILTMYPILTLEDKYSPSMMSVQTRQSWQLTG